MLAISEVGKSFGGRTLFSDVTLQVNRGDRIGLVGANGAGKSTLFSLILQKESPDAGTIVFQKGVTIGFLPQESMPVGDETVLELATAITPEVVHLQKHLKAWEAGHPSEVDDDHGIHARFDELGGHQLESRPKKSWPAWPFAKRILTVRPVK